CGLTVLEVLVVIGILGALMGLLIPAVMRVREAGCRTECANHLRQIGLALHHYHDAQRILPPGARARTAGEPYPFMSWNTRLLPFLEQDSRWKQAQEAF